MLIQVAAWSQVAARLLGLRVRNTATTLMSLSFESCVLSVGVYATNRSLVQRSPTECGVSECGLETSTKRRPKPIRAVKP